MNGEPTLSPSGHRGVASRPGVNDDGPRRPTTHPTPHQLVNVREDPEASAFVKRHNGGDEVVPTVAVGDRVLNNPSVREIQRALAPHSVIARAGWSSRWPDVAVVCACPGAPGCP